MNSRIDERNLKKDQKHSKQCTCRDVSDLTLTQNIEWIVDLNIHVITYGREFCLCRANNSSILAFNFV